MLLGISVDSSCFIWSAIKIYAYIEIQCYCLTCTEQNKPKYEEIDQNLFATEGKSYPYLIQNNYISRSAKIIFYCKTMPQTFPFVQILFGYMCLISQQKRRFFFQIQDGYRPPYWIFKAYIRWSPIIVYLCIIHQFGANWRCVTRFQCYFSISKDIQPCEVRN